jgi:hypothetical protein
MTQFLEATSDIRGDYRYSLTRVWDREQPIVTFVLLNPSTADEAKLDPTLESCVSFAKRDGFGGMSIVNLCAFRSTWPKVMKAATDPVGPENDRVLARVSGVVIAGWGNHADAARVAQALVLLPPLRALGINKSGAPKHPLYVRGDAPLVEWPP